MGTRCPAWVQKLPSQVHPSLDVPVAHWVTEYGVQVGTATGAKRIHGWSLAGLVGADGPWTATQVPPKETPPALPEQPTVGPGPGYVASTGSAAKPTPNMANAKAARTTLYRTSDTCPMPYSRPPNG